MKSTEAMNADFLAPKNKNENEFHSQQCDTEKKGVRCSCGALLARWVAVGLELKCRRCKRTTLIPFPKSVAKARPTQA
jgi:hypothetical protein